MDASHAVINQNASRSVRQMLHPNASAYAVWPPLEWLAIAVADVWSPDVELEVLDELVSVVVPAESGWKDQYFGLAG